jgi:DNA-binding MarR family transcriptional regulator
MSEMDVRWLDTEQQRDWRALVLGSTLLFDRLDSDLQRRYGISLAEYEILVRLSEREGWRMRMAQLADSVRHSRSRVTHTAKRLEQAGLVTRDKSPDDGRGVECAMTEAGMQLLETMAPTHVTGVREHLVDLVTPEDFRAVGRVMNLVSDHLIAGHPEMEIREQ